MKEGEEQWWKRGKIIGRGGYATVSLARTHHDNLPSLMAVKSVEFSRSISLIKEKIIISYLEPCPYIIRCYGDDFTFENGYPLYNLFLEYASGGSLDDRIKRSNSNGSKGLPESQVRLYARSILQGLKKIHQHGFVHCDIKPQNILIVSSSSNSGRNPENETVKIADFGLAKRFGEQGKNKGRIRLRGTPLYMAPESITHNEYEPHSDVWALGCVIVEMLTGEPAWNCSPDTETCTLLRRIGYSRELPCIPREISKEGRDFLNKCFVRNTILRWTPYMLLQHPFVDIDDEVVLLGEAVQAKEGLIPTEEAIGLVPSPVMTTISPVFTCLVCKKRQRTDNEAEEVKGWRNKRFAVAKAKQSKDTIDLEGGNSRTTTDDFIALVEGPSISTSIMNDPFNLQQYSAAFCSVDEILF